MRSRFGTVATSAGRSSALASSVVVPWADDEWFLITSRSDCGRPEWRTIDVMVVLLGEFSG